MAEVQINNNSAELTCVICIDTIDNDKVNDDQQVTKFNCGHILHHDCASRYVLGLFQKNANISCPTCRYVECDSMSELYKETQKNMGIKINTYHTVGFDIENTGDTTIIQIEREPIPLWKKTVLFIVSIMCIGFIAVLILLLIVIFLLRITF